MEWRDAGDLRWLEARMPEATAAFTTRLGGSSEAPFDALNLGILTDDERDAVLENRRRLASALGLAPDRIAVAHQVHGSELITHGDPASLRCSFASHEEEGGQRETGEGETPEADGHIIDAAGAAALVFAADCVPVALSGPRGVAMLHCGWRGLAAGIIAKGASAIGATDAAIGPSIGPCCYEVGAPQARSARGRPAIADRGRCRAHRAEWALYQLQTRALLLAPARSRPHRPAGGACLAQRGGKLTCLG
jgi:copper oxidase (laccase) domain-containing protein